MLQHRQNSFTGQLETYFQASYSVTLTPSAGSQCRAGIWKIQDHRDWASFRLLRASRCPLTAHGRQDCAAGIHWRYVIILIHITYFLVPRVSPHDFELSSCVQAPGSVIRHSLQVLICQQHWERAGGTFQSIGSCASCTLSWQYDSLWGRTDSFIESWIVESEMYAT